MKKLQIALNVIFVFLLVFVTCSTFQSQDIKQLEAGMPNTITLSNGEVVYNLNGEWASFVEMYGVWESGGTVRATIKITQTGSSLVGNCNGCRFHSKGQLSIRAELDKSGFKNVTKISDAGDFVVFGKIYDDGDKIILDDRVKFRETLTRQ